MDDSWRVDCFAYEEGTWEPRPANVCAVHASSKRAYRGRGDLYLLIQPAPNSVLSQTAIDALKDTAIKNYYESGGSVTRGLRAALIAGNTWLYEHNLRLDPDHRVALGLHYAVLRDREVYLGQIGPALATWVHGSAVDQYPPDSIWLRSETPTLYDLDREPPAGWRRDAEPSLFHITLSPADTLVLASPQLHHLVPPQALQQALALRGAESTTETIGKMTQGRDLTVLVVEWAPDGLPRLRPGPSATDEERAERRPAPPRPAAFPDLPHSPAVPVEPETLSAAAPVAATFSDAKPLETYEKLARGTTPTETAGELAQVSATETAAQPTDSTTIKPASIPEAPSAAPEGRVSERPSRSAPPAAPPKSQAEQHVATLPEMGEEISGQGDTTRRAGTAPPSQSRAMNDLRGNLSQGVERARQGTEELLTRVLPETSLEPAAELDAGIRPLSMVGRALLGVSLAIPLVMALMIIMTRVQYERAQGKVFAQIQELAQARYDAAATMENVTYRRKAMREAMATAQEGLAIDPQDELLSSLVRQIEHNLDGMDNVVRITRFTQLAELSSDVAAETDSGTWGSSARIVVQDLDLYVLDRKGSLLYHYLLNSAGDALQPAAGDAVMLRRGAIEEGVRIGEMIDITWMEGEGQRTRDGFAALDRTGSLVTYDLERGIDVTPVANSDTWVKPIALGCYSGNVYVLDPILGAILKYIPTNDAYVNPPSSFINPQVTVDLTGAVDMAIDGSVYVLFADGKIMKFFKGDPQPFDMGGLPGPMRSPTTLFISGEREPEAEGYVYVVDGGNNRILEFDKVGNYLRQFQPRAGLTQFQEIQGIYVDAQRGRLFVLSGNKLWYTSLPNRKMG